MPCTYTTVEMREIDAARQRELDRQREEVARRQAQESVALPPQLDYRTVRGLSTEAQQILGRHEPETIGQAARISGVTPAAISLLLVHLKKHYRPQNKKHA